MTTVVVGTCPDCGRSTGLAGALCYSNTTRLDVERVVPCNCGSRKKPT